MKLPNIFRCFYVPISFFHYLYGMKMIITEKQLSRILGDNKKEIDEADSLTSPSTSNQTTNSSTASPSTGTSTESGPSSPDAKDMEAYPSGTTKWADVVGGPKRGVANPAGPIKKREDYPEAEPTRGVANQLR